MDNLLPVDSSYATARFNNPDEEQLCSLKAWCAQRILAVFVDGNIRIADVDLDENIAEQLLNFLTSGTEVELEQIELDFLLDLVLKLDRLTYA